MTVRSTHIVYTVGSTHVVYTVGSTHVVYTVGSTHIVYTVDPGTDTDTDTSTDSNADPGTDTGVEIGTGTSTDIGNATATATSTDTNAHTGTDTDTGTHTGTDAGAGIYTQVGTIKVLNIFQGNIGTPTAHFLRLINSCRLPPVLVQKLGLKFDKKKDSRLYSVVPYNYSEKVISGSYCLPTMISSLPCPNLYLNAAQ